MTEPIKAWLSRNVDPVAGLDHEYKLWTRKPRKTADECFYNKGKQCIFITYLSRKVIERTASIKLSPGECRRVTIDIKLV